LGGPGPVTEDPMLRTLAPLLLLALCSCGTTTPPVDCTGVDREEMLAILQEANEEIVAFFGDRPHDLAAAPPRIQAAAARQDEASAMLLCIHRRDHALTNLLLLPVHLPMAVVMELATGGKP
jgi:hypothetical protein